MKRVWILGWDGADPDLIMRWTEAGYLPHLRQLTSEGGYLGPLCGVTPPVTFPAWTTCVTGVNPGRHGIPDFTVIPPGTRKIRFVTGNDRLVPAIWEPLSAAGARCAVLGVPATWPASPLNGVMIAGFDSPLGGAVSDAHVYPDTLLERVRRWRYADTDEHFTDRPGWHHRFAKHLENRLNDKLTIALELLDEEPWDFFMCVLGEADAASHHFWMFMDPQSPRFLPDETLSKVILQIYKRLDTFLGRVMDRADGETLILVVSDHGFTGAGIHQASLNRFLETQGWLQRRRHPAGLIKQVLLRGIPAGWRDTLARHFPKQVCSLESMARFGGIHWAHTRAWSEELAYFPSVRLNVSGRDPDGIIPQQHYQDTVLELCALLETWEPVRRAIPRWEVYDGPAAVLAPDILIEPAEVNGYPWSFGRWRNGPPTRTLSPEAYAGGREQGFNGVHRNPALLAMNARCRKPSPGLADIAPTVLAALGMTAPPHMEGSDLLALFPASTPPVSNGLFPETVRIPRHLTPEEEAQLEERLRRMGYLE